MTYIQPPRRRPDQDRRFTTTGIVAGLLCLALISNVTFERARRDNIRDKALQEQNKTLSDEYFAAELRRLNPLPLPPPTEPFGALPAPTTVDVWVIESNPIGRPPNWSRVSTEDGRTFLLDTWQPVGKKMRYVLPRR